MDRKAFNQTGRTVSPLGLGLAALGRPGYITVGHADDLNRRYTTTEMEAHAHQVLDAALAAGLRYFDAARSYGRAEAFLSSWLARRGLTPQEITVGSKWGYTYTAGWQVNVDGPHEVKEHSVQVLNRQIAESSALLGAFLNIYQIHSATLASGVLENVAVLNRLAELRREGLIIGLSVSGPGQGQTVETALEIRVDGEPLFGAVQATWNLFEQAAGPALAAAHAAGWGVIIKETVANGRLTAKNSAELLHEGRRQLQEVAAAHHCTPDAVAIAAALAQPWCDIALSGAATVKQLHENVRATTLTLSPAELNTLYQLRESSEAYWARRGRLAWN